MSWKKIVAHDPKKLNELFTNLFPTAPVPPEGLFPTVPVPSEGDVPQSHVHDPNDENQIISYPSSERLFVSDNREHCYGCGQPNCPGHTSSSARDEGLYIMLHQQGIHGSCHPLSCSQSGFNSVEDWKQNGEKGREFGEARSRLHQSGDHSSCKGWTSCPHAVADMHAWMAKVSFLHNKGIHDECGEGLPCPFDFLDEKVDTKLAPKVFPLENKKFLRSFLKKFKG